MTNSLSLKHVPQNLVPRRGLAYPSENNDLDFPTRLKSYRVFPGKPHCLSHLFFIVPQVAHGDFEPRCFATKASSAAGRTGYALPNRRGISLPTRADSPGPATTHFQCPLDRCAPSRAVARHASSRLSQGWPPPVGSLTPVQSLGEPVEARLPKAPKPCEPRLKLVEPLGPKGIGPPHLTSDPLRKLPQDQWVTGCRGQRVRPLNQET